MFTATKNRAITVAICKTLLLPLLIYLFFKMIRPATFGSPEALYIILQQSMVTSIIGLGLCCTMTIGLWDFSPGAIVTFVGCICGYYFNAHGFWAMVAAGILSGAIFGVVNASIYSILRVPSVVVTIGLLLIYESVASVYHGGVGVTITKDAAILGDSPWIFIVAGVMFVAMYLIYNKSKLGFNVRAVGNGELIAKSAGISPRRVKFWAFVLAGLYFGVAGLINLSYGTAITPVKNMLTMSVTFDAIMAVFIAIYLSGICNRVIAIVIGTFCMKLVSAGLVAIGVNGIWQQVIIGCFLLFFIGFTQIKDQFASWIGFLGKSKKIKA